VGFRGQSRTRIARRLSAAYATGLLSEDTYLGRLDELLSSAVVDEARIDGDLTLRKPERRHPLRDALRPIGRTCEWLADLIDGTEREPPALLGLDWSGATTELTLGRQPQNDVVLLDPAVSRRHAQLRYRDGRWIIKDLDSRNGSFVNGVRVGRSELRPGDVLTVGDRRLLVD
jgi:hypothetical protein